VNLKEKKIQV